VAGTGAEAERSEEVFGRKKKEKTVIVLWITGITGIGRSK